MISIDKIYDGDDKARETGFITYREMVVILSEKTNKPWLGEWDKSSVYARIDFGRWLADCECGAASYVSYTDNFYYCYTCGNASVNGAARKVIFPENKEEIEIELLKRKVQTRLGLSGTNGALNSKGIISRSWSPGETIETLVQQRLAILGGG